MQTKQQIEQLLASAGVRPNRRLGQNFLIDLNLMQFLIDAANINPTDVVLEVGCGTGSFTEGLSQAATRVIAVEYDTTLAKIAQRKLENAPHVTIINTDILESKSKLNAQVVAALSEAMTTHTGRLLLVANLPYSISSPLIIDLITAAPGNIVCDEMYITVQNEVAQRIVAPPGSKEYGTLSILTEATGQTKIIKKLKPNVFWPRPQVDSAMLTYHRQNTKIDEIKDMEILRQLVSLFLGHRRKMLKACTKFAQPPLANIHHWAEIFEHSFIDPHKRPEQLSAQNYIAIANLCHESLV